MITAPAQERLSYRLRGNSLSTLEQGEEFSPGFRSGAENTLEQVGGIVTDNTKTIKVVLEGFGKAAESANIFLEKGSSLVSGTNDSLSHLKRQLLITGQHLEKATENLNRLIELVADQPSQLIFGEPPVPRKVGSEDYER